MATKSSNKVDQSGVMAQLSPYVNVVAHSEAKPTLLHILGKHRREATLPDEPLSLTINVSNHTALQLEANSSFVPSYQLTHIHTHTGVQRGFMSYLAVLFPLGNLCSFSYQGWMIRISLSQISRKSIFSRSKTIANFLSLVISCGLLKITKKCFQVLTPQASGRFLYNALLIFQRMINLLLAGIIDDSLYFFLDDSIIFSKGSESDHYKFDIVFHRNISS